MTYNFKRVEYQPIFTKDEIKILDEINNVIPLDYFLNSKNLINKFGFDFIYTSAIIEGNTYSKADALTLIDYGKTAGGKNFTDAKMILNLEKALKYIIKNRDFKIDKFTIREIHSILADGLIEDNLLGRVRDSEVFIKGSDYIPLSNNISLESELDRVISISQNINNPYDKSLYLHNNIAYLQYFIDVNKRTARTIMSLSLKIDNKMILIPDEENISTYIEGILDYYENGKIDKSKEFFIKSYQKVGKLVKDLKGVV